MTEQQQQQDDTNSSFDVIIVGAGVAGCSAAFHLWRQQQQGNDDTISNYNRPMIPNSPARLLLLDAGPAPGLGLAPRRSGSATMMNAAPCVKMMVQVYAGSSAAFQHHHGPAGARRYLTATRRGLTLQKKIAQEIWGTEYPNHVKELGSYYVAHAEDEAELRHEYDTLLTLGCQEDGIEWCDTARLETVPGLSPNKYHCAIFFPNDAIIDSSLYAKRIVEYIQHQNKNNTENNNNISLEFRPNTRVVKVEEAEGKGDIEPYPVKVHLESGQTLTARHVVIATGAFLQGCPHLNGLIKPCYSYLVHVPTDGHHGDSTIQPTTTTPPDFSSNFFTWNFTHDWSYVNGKVRISGEDHFSAYKPPLLQERCANLARWTLQQYDCYDKDNKQDDIIMAFPQQYGLYSETPDMAPLVGSLLWNKTNQHNNNNNPLSLRCCHVLGCNAWGQTILSYCSSLVPGLLGYQELTQEQRDVLRLVSIRRFSEMPSL